MNEISTVTPGGPVTQAEGQPQSLLNFIATALERNIDTSSLRALLDMQREVQADQARREYAIAMNAAQADAQPVARQAENLQTKSKYAKLEHVDAMIRPVYIRHGFSLSFDEEPANDKGEMVIVCKVLHIGGHFELHRLNSPPDVLGPKGTAVKTVLHGRGSTVTFLRRYLTCNIFNIVLRNEDDDGVRGGTKMILPDQVDIILDGLKATGIPTSAFLLDMFNVHHATELTQSDYAVAVNAIRASKANQSVGWTPKPKQLGEGAQS